MVASSEELVQIIRFFNNIFHFFQNFTWKKVNWTRVKLINFRIFMAKRTERLKHISKRKLWSVHTLQFISLATAICLFCCYFARLLYCFEREVMMNNIREVADSHTPGIFIRDTAYFHCDSLNYESHFIG